MYDIEIHNNIYKNAGLSQFERFSDQINPDYFDVDEFDLEKFVHFLTETSKSISYFDESNKLVGDWSLFFKRDPTFSVIRLTSINIERVRAKYFEKMVSFQKTRDNQKLKDSIVSYAHELVNILMEIEQNIVQLATWDDFKQELQQIISKNLSHVLSKLLQIIRIKSVKFYDNYKDEFSNYWLSEDGPVENIEPSIKFIESIFSYYLTSLKLIKKTSSDFLNNRVLKEGEVSPHISLLLTFHELYKHASGELNNITGRHLDYYYKETLGIKMIKPQPHEAYVNFEIEDGVNQIFLEPNNTLKGGVSPSGADILYSLEKETIISQALLDEIIVLEMGNVMVKNTSLNDSTVSTKTYLLSQSQPKITKENTFGFSFGTKFLKNNEGYRKIKFKLVFTQESFSSFIYELQDYIETSVDDLNMSNILDDIFYVKYSSSEGWIDLLSDSVDSSILLGESGDWKPVIIIDTFIDVVHPPITALFDQEEDGDESEIFPEFQFLLNPIKGDLLFPLRMLKLSQIEVESELLDIKELVLSNDAGEIDSNSSFEPFGSQPIIGSSLYIGHPSIFLYPISELKLNIEWHGLPLIDGGFREYYEYYPDIESNDTFKVKISSLRDKRWLPEQEKQVLDLFETTSKKDSDALSSIRRMTEIDIKELGIDHPVFYDAQNFEYSSSSIAGFLKLELCFPLIAFGHIEYPEVTRLVAAKNAKEKKYTDYPNEPFTPVVKSLSLEVKSQMVYDESNKSSYTIKHIYPFGSKETRLFEPVFPDIRKGTSLILGFSRLRESNHLNLLIKFNDFINDIAIDNFNLQWSLFNGFDWDDLNAEHIIEDGTLGFKKDGIIVFNLPKNEISANDLFSDELCWLKCQSKDELSFLNYLEDIIPNAAKVICLNSEIIEKANIEKEQIVSFVEDIDGVTLIEQKYPSFNGKLKESKLDYLIRVSERLHHKNRAVTESNYEQLLLQRFPDVYKCKCLSNKNLDFELSPGEVLISVVPSISRHSGGEFVGKFSTIELNEMQAYLFTKTPIGIRIKVINPIYEKVRTKFNVKFRDGYDINNCIKKLNADISSFISPFLFRQGDQIEFSEVIQSTNILNTIEKQEYIDHVVNFSVFHLVNDIIINQSDAKKNSLEIIPTTDISILMTDSYHQISTYDDEYISDSGGINEMMIGTDYIVDSPEKEVKKGINTMTIGRNYKVLDLNDDKIKEKSNFTVHLNI